MKRRVHGFYLHRRAPVTEILLKPLLVSCLRRDHAVFERKIDRAVEPFPVPDKSLIAGENGYISYTLCLRSDLGCGLDELPADII